MKSRIKCFFLTPVDSENRYLRRYRHSRLDKDDCPVHGYHNAQVFIGVFDFDEKMAIGDNHSHADPRWPAKCDCGYEFVEGDQWQMFRDRLYQRTDNGELMTLRRSPAGAMWYADWSPWKGPDGHSLIVKTPGGEWNVDHRANNCTMPKDNVHRCWVRHGIPPLITVDKKGNTCAAGAGSIAQKGYHGFLRNGYLEEC